ncbi:MAG: AGE family epimerase/isomerase [Prolixibacteraceae bacterium]|jgi:mannobiose 2-epimerase|nr:AGE family epimerase/isomerase [Prolixibacteraceae bacterium]
MNRSIAEFIKVQEDELSRIMTFWTESAVDDENGGFLGAIDGYGKTVENATKGAVLNARILWTFSAVYNYTKNEKYLQMAKRAFDYFANHFIDKKNGGVFWELSATGEPVNKRKQGYAQGFAIYGLSEYYRATGNEKSLLLAQELFWTLEKHFLDKENGGYIEALGEDWNELSDMRLSLKDANEPKSMNTHLHILEPYTNLYRCWKNPILEKSIRNLIRVFLDKIIDRSSAHFNLFFDIDWKVKSTAVSFGHDIEGSWLLAEAAEVLDDKLLVDEVNIRALRMVDATMHEGTDADGSLFNEKDGEHWDTDKHWWPQAEAIIGYVNAWQITEEQKYIDEAEKVWNFIDLKMFDRTNGEWFWRVDKNGEPYIEEEKAGFWKCPYHNSRAIIEVCSRLKG